MQLLLQHMLNNSDKQLICNNSNNLDFIPNLSSFLRQYVVLPSYPQVQHILLCNNSLIIILCSSSNFNSYALMPLPHLFTFISSSIMDHHIFLLPLFHHPFMVNMILLTPVADKPIEYAAKNGPVFEAMIREKQDNPSYSFLFVGDGHGYYFYLLWLSTPPPPKGGPFNPFFPPSSMPVIHPPPSPIMNSSPLNSPPLNAAAISFSGSTLCPPQMNPIPFQQFYDQHHHNQHPHRFGLHSRFDHNQASKSYKGISCALSSDIAMDLNNVLSNLNGRKESIKGAKI